MYFGGFTSTYSRCAFLSRKVVGELLDTLSTAVSPYFAVLVIALLLLFLLLLSACVRPLLGGLSNTQSDS